LRRGARGEVVFMKTLYFVRHAKSSWEEQGVDDMERPLMEKGIARTKKIIRFLNKQKITVDLMISSPAVRAYETARLIAEGIDYPVKKIEKNMTIYDGSIDRILDLIYGTPNEVRSLMIFGHNPTITNLVNLFLHPGIEMMPTTGIVCLSFETDKWEEVPSVKGVQKFIISPKMV
jgi:phosphohistidine phosphatase